MSAPPKTGAEAWRQLHQLAEFEAHPTAKLFPPPTAEDIEEMAADILARGLLHPIVRDAQQRVLSGRTRWAACLLARVEPEFEETELSGVDAVSRVISEELRRRHMEGVALGAAIIGTREALAELRARPPQEQDKVGRFAPSKEGAQGKTRDKLATLARCSPRAAGQLLSLAENAPEELAKVSAGKKSLASAYRAVRQKAESPALVEARAREFYETPAWALQSLLLGEDPLRLDDEHVFWDPCAGNGALQKAAAAVGCCPTWVLGDIRPEAREHLEEFAASYRGEVFILIGDLLDGELERRWDNAGCPDPGDVAHVVTNPPFSLAREVAEVSWGWATDARLWLLQRLTWLDECRAPWLTENTPSARLLPERLHFIGPDGSEFKGTDSTLHCWYQWDNRELRGIVRRRRKRGRTTFHGGALQFLPARASVEKWAAECMAEEAEWGQTEGMSQ